MQYSVNGEASVNSNSRSLTLSTGLTVSVLGTGTTTVTVAQNGSSIANALASFANAYNAAAAELSKNRGQNGGALSGDSTVYSLTELMNNIANYTGTSGSVLLSRSLVSPSIRTATCSSTPARSPRPPART